MPHKRKRDRQRAKHKHYVDNIEDYRRRRNAQRQEKRDFLNDIKASTPCMDCHQSFSPYVMDFDHRDPSQKEYMPSQLPRHSWAILRAEIAKCDIVCANCHRVRTHDPTWKARRSKNS